LDTRSYITQKIDALVNYWNIKWLQTLT